MERFVGRLKQNVVTLAREFRAGTEFEMRQLDDGKLEAYHLGRLMITGLPPDFVQRSSDVSSRG